MLCAVYGTSTGATPLFEANAATVPLATNNIATASMKIIRIETTDLRKSIKVPW
jgi:hypothetical protein